MRVFQRRRAGELESWPPSPGDRIAKDSPPRVKAYTTGKLLRYLLLPAVGSCAAPMACETSSRCRYSYETSVTDAVGAARLRDTSGVVGTPRGGADAGRSRAQDVGHEAAVEAPQPLARPEVAHGARGCRVLHHVAPDDGALLQDGADHLCANSR